MPALKLLINNCKPLQMLFPLSTANPQDLTESVTCGLPSVIPVQPNTKTLLYSHPGRTSCLSPSCQSPISFDDPTSILRSSYVFSCIERVKNNVKRGALPADYVQRCKYTYTVII